MLDQYGKLPNGTRKSLIGIASYRVGDGKNNKIEGFALQKAKLGYLVGRPRANIGPIHRISRNLVEMFLMPVQTQPEA